MLRKANAVLKNEAIVVYNQQLAEKIRMTTIERVQSLVLDKVNETKILEDFGLEMQAALTKALISEAVLQLDR